ncbi:TIGR00303 family protein, partial [Natronoarchaeum mannanilyticum]
AALVRHAGVEVPLSLATTSFVADDPNVDLDAAAREFDLDLTITDPGFDRSDHVAMARYVAGEAKEGVGTGGALALADRSDASMAAVRDRIEAVYDRLDVDDISSPTGGASDGA